MESYILTITCKDKGGIVAAVSGFLFQYEGFIVESQQFGDQTTGLFFMRILFSCESLTKGEWEQNFQTIAKQFGMKWELQSINYRMKVLIMVSREGHCLNVLLNKRAMGNLQIEVPAIVSNHTDLEKMANVYDIPFYHFPVDGNKEEQEREIFKLVDRLEIDLIVLARYMQILSPDFTNRYVGKIINIHHSFLPSFIGKKPYHQAYERGVKIIGATAHYVTNALDEGPIIEQDVTRVNHTCSPADLISLGQDSETVTLARAIKWHIQKRVFINGNKTVVFS